MNPVKSSKNKLWSKTSQFILKHIYELSIPNDYAENLLMLHQLMKLNFSL